MPPVIPDKIPCDTLQQFLAEVSSYKETLELTENEETWDRIERAFLRFSAVIKGGGHQFKKELVDAFKTSYRPVVSALNSERTRLSTTTMDCIGIAAPRLGLDFEALVPIYVPAILRLSNRTNKVYVKRSHTTMDLIIGFCHIPSILPHLITACKESKIPTGRTASIDSVLRALNKWDWTQKDIRNKVAEVEEMIRITGRDKDASIRQTSRQVFETYKNMFPERVSEFIAPLTPVMRKYLEIKAEERGRPMAKTTFSNSVTASSTGESNSLGLSIRSTSTQRVEGHPLPSKSKNQNPRPPITSARTMPPPIIVPNKGAVGPGTLSHSAPEDQDNQERQRLLSSISSTFSVKSVPASSKPFIEHQPPVRLGPSQTRSASVSAKPTLTSSGPARRVRRVVSIEQTNRPDLFAMAKRAATRTVPQIKNQSESIGVSTTIDQGGISFPKSDPSLPGMERRGAQRVPKPIPLPPPVSTLSETKVNEAASVATSEAPAVPIPKRETKPSLFRRGVNADDKKEKAPTTKEGFVPRRGGLLQPTLSQLNKQKPTVSSAQSRPRMVSTFKRSDVKKVANTKPAGPASQLVKTNSGESDQQQDQDGKDTQISPPSSTLSGPEKSTEITDQTSESKEGADTTGTEVVPELESSIPKEVSTENDNLAVYVKEIQTGDEMRSGDSTPGPQTPSSSNIDKEVSKEIPENIEFIPEAMHDISTQTNVASTASENTKSPNRIPLVEVLVNE